MKKNGVSAIVATVLIILITVAGVTIVWTSIIPMIQQGLEFSELDGRVQIVTSGGWTIYDAERGIAIVQVKRDFDDLEMGGIRIIFSINGSSYGSSVVAPEPGETRAYIFNLSNYGEPDSVSVVPIFIVGELEKEGTTTSDVEISSGKIYEVDGFVYELEEDYTSGDFTYNTSDESLVLYLPFDGDADDYSGEGNDGTIVGNPSYTTGKYGQALLFDGDDSVDCGNDQSLKMPDNNFTVEAWVKTTTGNGDRLIFSTYGSYTGYTTALYEGKPKISLPGIFQWLSGTVNNDTWHHLAWTVEKNLTVLKVITFYVDGDKTVGFRGAMSSQNLSNNATNRIGTSFIGAIDEVRVYNRALSEEEIVDIYNNGN